MKIRRLVAASAACAVAISGVATAAYAAPAAKTYTVKLSGVTFGGKKNFKQSLKVGDSVKFVWAGGFHNVMTTKVPTGIKKTSTPVTDKHAPVTVKFSKAGTYSYFCTPHKALGMTATFTV